MEFQFNDNDHTTLEINDVNTFIKDRLEGVKVGEKNFSIEDRIKFLMNDGETKYLNFRSAAEVDMELVRLGRHLGTKNN